jgi:hypothetical protein
VLLWAARKSEPHPVLRWSLAALAIAILPPLHLLGGAADLSGGRLLYLPSVFFCLFLASTISGSKLSGSGRKVGAFLIVFAFVEMFIHDVPFWQSTSKRVKEICMNPETAPNPLPGMIDGVPALANGFAECVEIAKKH